MNQFNLDKKTAMPWAAIDLVSQLIQLNEIKHPGQKWRKQSKEHHLSHAMDHLNERDSDHQLDTDSGMPILVHAATRLLLAVEQEIKEQNEKLRINF